MPDGELPEKLLAALQAARAVEDAACGQRQRLAAVTATARLLIAALDVGWRVYDLAPAAGLTPKTAAKRVQTARARGIVGAGLKVPPPPVTERQPRANIWLTPAEQREWLTVVEAAELAGVDPRTIARWRQRGLLPNTWWTTPVRPAYLRADVLRIARQPRWRNGGVNAERARALLPQSPP